MRIHFVSAVLVVVLLVGFCSPSTTVEAQGYHPNVVYYQTPQVVYYQTYRPTNYARTEYYGQPEYYSYYSPSCVYYVQPVSCESSASYGHSDRSGDSAQQRRPTKPTTLSTVGAYDNRFLPQPINVQPGTTVRWVNYGQHNHTVTANDGSWDSGDIKPGASYSATFKQPGSYYYYCRHHTQDKMQGVVVVASDAASGTGGTQSSGY